MGTKCEDFEKSLDILRIKKITDRRTDQSLTFSKKTLTNKNATHVPKKDRKSKSEKKLKKEHTQLDKTNQQVHICNTCEMKITYIIKIVKHTSFIHSHPVPANFKLIETPACLMWFPS